MKLTILGSGGWIPTARRETCCALVEDGDRVLLVDAGSGVAHLVAQPELLGGRRELDILLTHFHGDHTVGLSFLPALGCERVSVYGPGAALYGIPTRAILERVFSRPQAAFDLADIVREVHEVGPGESAVGGIAVELRRQDMHPDPTLGVRLGDDHVWCTDTGADSETASFARGARVLYHDMWELEAGRLLGHASGAGAGRLAAAAGVERLVGIHLNPAPDIDHEAIRHEAAGFFANAQLGVDLASF